MTSSVVLAHRWAKEPTDRFTTTPFVKTEAFDLDNYVVAKALDGLFHVLGEQEREIRANPAARATDLLREVFAKR